MPDVSLPVNRKVAILIIFSFLITLILRIILIGYYKHDYGGIDMNVVYGIQRMLTGQPLYQDPQLPPYAIIQYTPVYYRLIASLAGMLHIQAPDVQAIYELARTTALCCNLLTIAVMILIFRLWRFSMLRAILFSLPLLMILTPHYYLRGDSLHLLFFVLTVYWLIAFVYRPAIRQVLYAAFFSACCIMTKQSGILCAGIAGYYFLFMSRQYRCFICYIVVLTLSAVLLLWCCNGNNWQGFYLNTVLGLKNGISAAFLYTMFISQFYYDLILCYATGAVMVYTAIRYSRDAQYRFVAMAAALSFVFAVLTGFKTGSSNNYFTEFLFFVLLALPFLLQADFNTRILLRIKGRTFTIRYLALTAFVILIASKTIGFFTSMYIEKRLVSLPVQYRREQQLYRYFTDSLHIRPGQYIYFNENSFLNNIFIEFSIMPLWDVVSQVYLADAHTYDYSSFIGGMNKGLVTYVVVCAEDDNINKHQERLPFYSF